MLTLDGRSFDLKTRYIDRYPQIGTPMAIPLVSTYLLTFFSVLVSLFSTSRSQPLETLDPNATFSFQRFGNSDSKIALYGDAQISNSAVRISSRGRMIYMKPIRFRGTKPGFSTKFSFSISPGDDGGTSPGDLIFSLVPSNASLESTDEHQFARSPSVFLVKFVASRGGGHIEVNLGGEVSIRSHDLSSINVDLNDGKKLQSWIDYDGESKRVQVRVSNAWDPWSTNSSISHQIDLSGMLWREAMSVGISSSSGNSTQTTSVYSWDFVLRHGAPYRMHSEPLDPNSFLDKHHEGPPIHLRRVYPMRILGALIFAVTCGLLVAIAILFMLSVMFDRRPVAPIEYPEHPIECRAEKIVLVEEKGADSTAKQ